MWKDRPDCCKWPTCLDYPFEGRTRRCSRDGCQYSIDEEGKNLVDQYGNPIIRTGRPLVGAPAPNGSMGCRRRLEQPKRALSAQDWAPHPWCG